MKTAGRTPATVLAVAGRLQVLTIMKDSRIGSYGSAGLVLMLLGKALALIELANIDLTLALVALLVAHPLSRLASTSLIHFLDYVREDESASPGRWRDACRHTSSPSRCCAAHRPCCCCPRCRRSEPSRWRHWSPGAPRRCFCAASAAIPATASARPSRRASWPAISAYSRHGTSSDPPPQAGRGPGTCYGRTDLPPLEPPHQLAAALRRLLPPDFALYASPLQRARLLAEALGAPSIEGRLQEIDFGEWEGRSFEAIGNAIDAWAEDPLGFRAPGGESPHEMAARVMAAFAEIRDRHAAGPVVIVATGTLAGDCGRVAGDRAGALAGARFRLRRAGAHCVERWGATLRCFNRHPTGA